MTTQRLVSPDIAYTLSIMPNVCLFCVERRGIGVRPDLVGRALLCLFQHDITLSMFSQSSASGNFCFVVFGDKREIVLSALTNELRDDLQCRDITGLIVSDNVALISVILSPCEVASLPKRQERAQNAMAWLSEKLAATGINILAITQSGAGISLLVHHSDLTKAMSTLDLPAPAVGAHEVSVITLSHETYFNVP